MRSTLLHILVFLPHPLLRKRGHPRRRGGAVSTLPEYCCMTTLAVSPETWSVCAHQNVGIKYSAPELRTLPEQPGSRSHRIHEPYHTIGLEYGSVREYVHASIKPRGAQPSKHLPLHNPRAVPHAAQLEIFASESPAPSASCAEGAGCMPVIPDLARPPAPAASGHLTCTFPPPSPSRPFSTPLLLLLPPSHRCPTFCNLN